MKKILPWIIGLVSILILTGCGGDSKKLETILVDNEGSWRLKGYGYGSVICTFYSNGTFDWRPSSSSSITNSGNFIVNEEEKTITLDGKSSIINYTKVEVKNDENIKMFDGKKEISLVRESK
ncbi:lipoprotein [Enterococcus hirae]|uniref:LptM family lipoprotein n=1 Tax=Enterococcus hirae TaxID=1354 RepID=UPI001377F5B2|nr:hypothetical protein [Enterococcus hirae]NBA54941.1 hypothetical protein [Enterococcus hirae]